MSRPGYEFMWIAWEAHRRSRSLVDELGYRLFELTSSRNRLIKHPAFVCRTWALIHKHRPRSLVIQSPSMVLNILAVMLKPFYGYRLLVDAHNAGVYSCERLSDPFRWIYPFLQKRADVTIVTNDELAGIVSRNGGVPHVLIDPVPTLRPTVGARGDSRHFAFICTYAVDEPFDEVFAAAKLLPPDVVINVTGNAEANRHLFRVDPPANINFTGFLPEEEFVNLLAGSAAVIDLTTWDDCLVCGGYESMAVGTPLILSDTPVNRSTFKRGVVYCDNTAAGIAKAVRDVLADGERLRDEAALGKTELQNMFRGQLEALELGRD